MPSRRRQLGAVAELDGQVPLRLVQHGLAVEADDSDVARRQAVGMQERGHRLGVGGIDHRLGLRQHTGAVVAIGQVARAGDRAPQHRAFAVVIGAIAGGTEAADAFAVGIDQRNVDPVVGGPAHQADRRQVTHRWLRGIVGRKCSPAGGNK